MVLLLRCLFAFTALVAACGEQITVPLRVDRTATTDSIAVIDFGAEGLPDKPGRAVTGRTPGGIPVTARRVEDGYLLEVGGVSQVVVSGGSIAVEAGGLPYVVELREKTLRWIAHYQSEGMLAVGPCRERLVVFDDDADGRFDNLRDRASLGVDLYHDGRLRFGRTFEFCGRMISAESISTDGSSITFRVQPPFAPKVGEAAPAITLTTLDGKVVRPGMRRPKPLLLDFWATWCSVCVSEFPAIRKLHDSGLIDTVSINVDDAGQIPAAREILRELRPAWPQVLTGQGAATSAWQVFQGLSYAGGLPVYVLIDSNGVLRYGGTGGGPELPEVKAVLGKLR